jgi:carbonic anhydrase
MGDGIEAPLGRNREFAARGGHEGQVIFPKLRLFVVTCIDPRTDPAHFLGLDLSDALVLRNVGGRVTPEVIDDVELLRAAPAVPDRVRVSGHAYDVTTGLVETFVPAEAG